MKSILGLAAVLSFLVHGGRAVSLPWPRIRPRTVAPRRTAEERYQLILKLALPFLLVALVAVWGPRVTGGRLGAIFVRGDSAFPKLRSGDIAVALPLAPCNGDLVSAYGVLYDPRSEEDLGWNLMIKKYDASTTEPRLVSLNGGAYSTNFEVRGRIVLCLRLPWVSTPEAEKATRPPPTAQQRADAQTLAKSKNLLRESFLKSGDRQWKALDGFALSSASTKDKDSRTIILNKPYSGTAGLLVEGSAGTVARVEVFSGEWAEVLKADTGGPHEPVRMVLSRVEKLRVTLELVETAGGGGPQTPSTIKVIALRPIG